MHNEQSIKSSILAGKLSFLLAGVGMAPWAAIMPYVKDRLNLDELSYAYLILCFGIGAVIGMPLTGYFVKKLGVRPCLVIATLFLFISLVLISSPLPYEICFIVVIAWGFFLGITEVSNNVHGTLFEDLYHKHLLSSFHAFATVGCLLSAILYPILLSVNITPLSLAVGLFLLNLLGLIYCQKHLLNTHGQRDKKEVDNNTKMPFTFIVLAGIACLLMYLCEGMVYDWSGVFLHESCKVPLEIASVGYVTFQLCVAIMLFFGDRITTRAGGRRLLTIGAIIAFITLMTVVFSSNAIVVVIAFAILGLSLANTVPVIMSHTAAHCGENKSKAISIVGTLGYAGVLVGPGILGFFAMHFGLHAIFACTATLCLIMAWLCFVILKVKKS